MFKKYKLAAAMLAAVTTGAQAVYVNEDKLGEVVLLPYYNVNNNFVTNIAITNTTNLYKAVKVRFRESNLSNDVLDFNVYMSPQDQWTATVRLNPTSGKANISTVDETCTYPDKSLLQQGQDFLDFYTDVDTDDTLEGYVEIIEMGVIADGPGDAIDDGAGGNDGDYAEIEAELAAADGTVDGNDVNIVAGLLHGTDGVPADCSVVADAWDAGMVVVGNNPPVKTANGFSAGALTAGIATDIEGAAVDDPYADVDNAGLVSPTGGLHAYAILLNTETGAAFVEEGTHLNDYSGVPQHYQSDDENNYLLPSLASGDRLTTTMLNATGTGIKTVGPQPLTYFDTGALMNIDPNAPIPSGANPFPISIALAKTMVATPFFVNPEVSGATDVVLTMPMRKHGIWNGATLVDQADGAGPVCVPGVNSDGYALFPVAAGADCTNWAWNPRTDDDVVIEVVYYDDEEQKFSPEAGAPGFSPVREAGKNITILEREVNIVSLLQVGSAVTSVLGTPAGNVKNLPIQTGWAGGWATISFAGYDFGVANNQMDDLIDPQAAALGGANAALTMLGVPTIGFTAMDADIGPGSVGETVDHIRYIDR